MDTVFGTIGIFLILAVVFPGSSVAGNEIPPLTRAGKIVASVLGFVFLTVALIGIDTLRSNVSRMFETATYFDDMEFFVTEGGYKRIQPSSRDPVEIRVFSIVSAAVEIGVNGGRLSKPMTTDSIYQLPIRGRCEILFLGSQGKRAKFQYRCLSP